MMLIYRCYFSDIAILVFSTCMQSVALLDYGRLEFDDAVLTGSRFETFRGKIKYSFEADTRQQWVICSRILSYIFVHRVQLIFLVNTSYICQYRTGLPKLEHGGHVVPGDRCKIFIAVATIWPYSKIIHDWWWWLDAMNKHFGNPPQFKWIESGDLRKK